MGMQSVYIGGGHRYRQHCHQDGARQGGRLLLALHDRRDLPAEPHLHPLANLACLGLAFPERRLALHPGDVRPVQRLHMAVCQEVGQGHDEVWLIGRGCPESQVASEPGTSILWKSGLFPDRPQEDEASQHFQGAGRLELLQAAREARDRLRGEKGSVFRALHQVDERQLSTGQIRHHTGGGEEGPKGI
ncbi:unnamed protein product [Sphagnum tenellum]